MSEIRTRQRDRDRERIRAEGLEQRRQESMIGQMQQSVASYLQSRNLPADPKSTFYKEVQARVQAAQSDPTYLFTGGNVLALSAIITNEVLAERGAAKSKAEDKSRSDAIDGAQTEPAGAGNGAKPGQKQTTEKMYFRTDEAKWIDHVARKDGKPRAEVERNWWAKLDPEERRRRSQARSA